MKTGMIDWMNPLNKITIQLAVKNRDSEVTLKDGRRFSLTYSEFKPAVSAPYEVVTLIPDRELVPRGQFKVDEILNPEWISRNDNSN